MARSEKLLLALASLFFAGTIFFGFFGVLKDQYRFLNVESRQKQLFWVWQSSRPQFRFLPPERLPQFRHFLVPGTQAPFAANPNLIGKRREDFRSPSEVVALYEPHPGTYHAMRSVVFLDGRVKQLSPEKWEKARRESGIVENPPALRLWWKFWQSGPREFFPREAFAAVCIELWLSFCVLNAIWFGRWAGARRGFGRFWFSLASSFVIGLGFSFVFLMASSLLRL